MSEITAIRARAVTFRGDPFLQTEHDCLVYHDDAVVVMREGRISAFGPAKQILAEWPDLSVRHEPDCILSTGFVDAHVHYPQTEMVGAYGEGLLGWLEHYVFPTEQRFADQNYAAAAARVFMQELLRCGTTTAAVYATVHRVSVDAFFEESQRWNTRMVAGKVLMDRHAPTALLEAADRAYEENTGLIQRWHGKGRQHYAVTPRFAPSCSEALLEIAGALVKENDFLYVQSHLCESMDEIRWVRELFPERKNYLDVYAHAGLVGDRSIFGHGIHLNEEDFKLCFESGAALAHCPTSNFFLGSGLFRMADAKDARRPLRVGLGTDIGAGTSFCQLQTLNEAYKAARMQGNRLSAAQAFYLATRGGAQALSLQDRIGTIGVGMDADVILLDPRATPLMAYRQGYCESIADELFTFMTLGDDRAVKATYVAGKCVYERDGGEHGSGLFTPPQLS